MSVLKKIINKKNPNFYMKLRELKKNYKYIKKKNTKPEHYGRELEKLYYERTGMLMDINNPKTYNEKIQWLKINELSPLRTQLADKVRVTEWIAKKIGKEYLIPCLGIYDSFDDINFDELPKRFVLKVNHAAGWNVIVKDKEKFNRSEARKKFRKWLKRNYAFWANYEMHYSQIEPKIVVEEYIEDSKGQLNDYKFLCFNGIVKYCWVDLDRYENHKRNIYDLDWNLQPWNQKYECYEGEVNKPDNFDKMIELANILCQGFKHVRVDLYNVDGKIYFGEMTFTNGGGYEYILPEYDKMLGDLIEIN